MPSSITSASPAEAKDRHIRMAALGLLLIALKFGLDATAHFVSPETAELLDYGTIAASIGAVLLILPLVFYKVFRLDPRDRAVYFSDQSFAMDALKRAQVFSWSVTFLLLVFLEILVDEPGALAPGFYLQAALTVMLGSTAVAFLVLSRDPGEEGLDA